MTRSSMEQHCPNGTGTFDSKWPDGSKSYGGFADYWRGKDQFVMKIPDEIPSDQAAPMLCGGITAFHPLIQHGAGPDTRVGIIGLGGLGHFGLMGAAQALKCKSVVVISRTNAKKEDAMKMGATGFIATDEDKDWADKNAGTLDLIVSTVSSHKMPLPGYLQLLALKGKYVHVGAPEDVIPPFNSMFVYPRCNKSNSYSVLSHHQARLYPRFAHWIPQGYREHVGLVRKDRCPNVEQQCTHERCQQGCGRYGCWQG